jgi:hypothetical protein
VSRRWVLERAAKTGAKVFTPHFAGSSAGTVEANEDGFRWTFI